MIKFEKKILKDLYNSVNGLFAFTFYSRYKIRPDEILKFIHKYKEKGIVNYESNKIILTKSGRDIILKNRFIINSGNGKFSNIPEEFKTRKIQINEPYLPNINKISAEILKKKKAI
jgi:hypothetical protein